MKEVYVLMRTEMLYHDDYSDSPYYEKLMIGIFSEYSYAKQFMDNHNLTISNPDTTKYTIEVHNIISKP